MPRQLGTDPPAAGLPQRDAGERRGENEGSCKTLGLALLEGLSGQEAPLAVGRHYRTVLATPEDTDHGNIRNLAAHGLAGVSFAGQPLVRKG